MIERMEAGARSLSKEEHGTAEIDGRSIGANREPVGRCCSVRLICRRGISYVNDGAGGGVYWKACQEQASRPDRSRL